MAHLPPGRRAAARLMPGASPAAGVAARSVIFWPPLLALGVGVILAADDGGYPTGDWPFVCLFLLALLTLSHLWSPPATRESARAGRLSLCALIAFCAWSAVSTLWADVPEIAWEGAHRTLLYVIVFALVAARSWPPGALVAALGLAAGGIVILALWVLVTGAVGNPSAQLIEGRLSAPVGYANATAALWLLGLWPALVLACRPCLAWPWRAAALGGSCLLAEMALLAQSRGSVLGFAAGAAVVTLVTRDRWRVVLALLVVLAATSLAAGTLLHVREAGSPAGLVAALDAARTAMAATVLAAALACAAAIVTARRLDPAAADRLRWGRRANRAVVALALAGAVAGLVAIGDPIAWSQHRWADFRSAGYTQVDTGASRFGGSLGSGRYDFYRVALAQWRQHPLVGIGYDNFQVPYLANRRTREAPLYAHSLLLGVLAGTGLVGAALLGAFFFSLGAGVRGAFRAHPEARGLGGGALAGAAGWVVHGQFDWLWAFPALGVVAFALLGLALHAGAPAQPPSPPARVRPRSVARRRASRVAGIVTALAIATSLTCLGLAARLSAAAYDEAANDPAAALVALDRASRLAPLSADPLVTRGIIARRIGRADVARMSLQAALEREPANWFAHLELGMLDAASGRRAAAIAELDRSARLNPGQALVGVLGHAVLRGEAIDPSAVERELLQDVQGRLTPLARG